jgi:hypothetical protein
MSGRILKSLLIKAPCAMILAALSVASASASNDRSFADRIARGLGTEGSAGMRIEGLVAAPVPLVRVAPTCPSCRSKGTSRSRGK